MDTKTIGQIARRMGHRVQLGPTPSGRRFWIACSCGWGQPNERSGVLHPVTAATEREAVRRGAFHIRREVETHVREFRSNGVSVPADVGGGL